MNTAELVQFAITRAFDILEQTTADLTQEQADWVPPGLANPIGATYWHTIASTDAIVHDWCRSLPPLSQTAGWEEKVVVDKKPRQEGDHGTKMRIRIDLAPMHDYAKAVTAAVESWLASLTPEDLDRHINTPIGEMNLGQTLESFVAWHVSAHCGEIAALKGCLGARGYPF